VSLEVIRGVAATDPRERSSPQAYFAMIAVGVCAFVTGAVLGVWSLRLLAGSIREKHPHAESRILCKGAGPLISWLQGESVHQTFDLTNDKGLLRARDESGSAVRSASLLERKRFELPVRFRVSRLEFL
jgi:hypothetical protein